jgi:hypothetical protein
MNRTLLAICLSLGLGAAYAAEPAGNGEYGEPACPKAAAKAAVAAATAPSSSDGTSSTPATPAPARARSGSGGNPTRMASPRWHSLLPGMFR